MTSAVDQPAGEIPADVAAFLESGAAFGGVAPVRRIDTHAATIFLTGDRAWKLKRPVRFGYLDFSTAPLRQAALQSELRLNRRTAAQYYVGLHSITRNPDNTLGLDGTGVPVDWVLEMRRFPDGALLAEMADRGALDERLMRELAGIIAQFHRDAPIVSWGSGAPRFLDVVRGNKESLQGFPDILPRDRVQGLSDRLLAQTTEFGPLLDRRGHEGHVRHCHGDLHLANIALVDGRPLPFDCLEFSAALATIDVLYDLAFLLMDLWQRGLRFEANVVFNRYLDLSPLDDDGVMLLPLFMSVRAAIRAHVTAARCERTADEADLAELARSCLDLANEMLDAQPVRLIAIGGLSGTGKSSIARLIGGELGRAPGARILRSDVVRKTMAGKAPEDRLPPASYTAEQSRLVYRRLGDLAASILAQKHIAIVDAVFAHADERRAIEAVARAAGVPFTGFWLHTPDSVRADRVSSRIADASDADAALVLRQAEAGITAPDGWESVSTDGSLDEAAARLLAHADPTR